MSFLSYTCTCPPFSRTTHDPSLFYLIFFRYTPLHYSAAYNFLDFLEEFIENGATIDIGDQKGAECTCLHSDLLSHSSRHTYCLHPHTPTGATPLHLAALNGRLEATRILLHRGADPNIAARSGDTPLHLGALNGHADVVSS